MIFIIKIVGGVTTFYILAEFLLFCWRIKGKFISIVFRLLVTFSLIHKK